MNPCRCGFASNSDNQCTCTPKEIRAYTSRISGPLLDRIDLHVEIPSVPYKDMSRDDRSEPSSEIRKRIVQARHQQFERLGKGGTYTNARMRADQLRSHCALTPECDHVLENAVTRLGLSARGWNRIHKVARTIAVLEVAAKIAPAHIAEAIRYRKLDRAEA
jgi:magnesium chelatase family protein